MTKQSKLLLVVFAHLFLLVNSTFGTLPKYEIIDLGPGAATGINDAGQVTGGFPTAIATRAFLWDKTTGMTDLGTLGGIRACGIGVNDAGQVVGWSSTGSGEVHAFLWDKTSGMIDLGTLPGYAHSEAWGINNAGQVVGQSGATAFLWEDGKMIDLGTLGGSSSSARAINNIGHVVGRSSFDQSYRYHAFLWDSINGMRDLGVLPSSYSNCSIAHSINDCGQIVGISDDNVFLWEDGEMTDLGTLGQYSEFCAINDAGQVVGAAAYNEGEYYAFYWDAELGMIRLDELVLSNLGWKRLESARDINNRGQIVGYGLSDEWVNHAFVMTPVPEPAIEAEIDIDPGTLNLSSKGKWITCYICLPEDYDVVDIDPNSVLLDDEIQPESLRLDEQQQVAIAKFNRSDVQDILNVGDVELTISGQLTDGTIFEATDVIRVLNKAGRKPPK